MGKVYIRYCRPFKDQNDEPPIDEVWSDGTKPKKKLKDESVLFVYDEEFPRDATTKLVNQRPWDGIE